MNAAERYRRVSETFDSAISLPAGERERYLDEACSDDPEIRADVARLLEHYEEAGSFLETPPGGSVAADTLAPGELVAARYRIEALIGRGGMGEVYRATDAVLGETIALKVLRPELAKSARITKRFQREIALARRVTHANVCRVYDAGVDGERYFFTMELVEGESVADRIRAAFQQTGAGMSKEQALPIIRQIAAGLTAIHEMGIVHRDLKPANILLSGSGPAQRAIVTDFGLAFLEDHGRKSGEGSALAPATLTLTAQIAGTIAYMSPEQITGGEVTKASDIYSLGVILYEMATGRRPFEDRNLGQAAVERNGAPPDARKLVPGLDGAWASAIERCLQKDPRKRFPSAEAVAAHFERFHVPMPAWSRRKWWTVSAGAAISIAAMSQGSRALRYFQLNGEIPEGAQALLSPIQNLTGDARFDGITELFRNQVAQSVHMNLIDAATLESVLTQMGAATAGRTDGRTMQQATLRANAALWISGQLAANGTGYGLNLHVETMGSQPGAPRAQVSKTFYADDETSLMRSVREAALMVREFAGESRRSIDNFDRLPADVTTPSWQAFRHFARSQDYYLNRDLGAAVLELDAALREDPQFTLAAIRRADILTTQHRQSESFPQWRQALGMLRERAVTASEEMYARGMFAFDTGDMEAADRHFGAWSRDYPRNWQARYYRGLPLMLNGHAGQARELLRALRAEVPQYGEVLADLIACCLILGETGEAREYLPAFRKLTRPERANLREGYIRFREGDCVGYLDSLRAVENSTTDKRSAVDAMIREGMLLIDCGYAKAAAERMEAFLRSHNYAETAAQQAVLRIVQAWAEMEAGDRAAVGHAREALEADTGPVLVALAGTIFARLHEPALAAKALDLCRPLLDFPLYQIAAYRIQGEQALAAGRKAEAIGQFQKAAQLEPKIAHRQYLMAALADGPERNQLAEKAIAVPWQMLRPPPLHCLGSLKVAMAAMPGLARAAGFGSAFASSSRKLASYL